MKIKKALKEYSIITISTLTIVIGVYFFKFPNNFSFGGVTGLSVVLSKVIAISPGTANLIINVLLLILGFIVLGKKFAVKTIYASMLLSICLTALEYFMPLKAPLTNEPMLELIFAVALPAFGSAMLFNIDASSGGTDILAMILKKYSSFNIGHALFLTDILITLSAFFVFDKKTALFSLLGLMAKSLAIDNAIENINLAKYFNVMCSNPQIICDFIINQLHRSATVCDAQGAFSHKHKYIIFTALRRSQAVQLRRFIKRNEPDAFILISNTSEIIGKGFRE